MKVRKQDKDGDMVFGQGLHSFYVDDAQAVGQLIMTRLKLWQGEWFAEDTEGVPYISAVLGRSSPSIYDSLIRARIVSTPGVREIKSYGSRVDSTTRTLTIQMSVVTSYGNLNLTTAL